jgi:hypothetical protein
VAVGAVVVGEAALDPWTEAFADLCERLKVPDGTEVKWSPPKGDWLREQGAPIRPKLLRRMLRLAIDHGVRSMVVIADQDQAGPLDPVLLAAYRGQRDLFDAARAAQALRPDGDRRARRRLERTTRRLAQT